MVPTRRELHALWSKLNNSVEQALASTEKPHFFMDRFFERLGVDRGFVARFVRQTQVTFGRSLSSSAVEIPAISHRLWVTAPGNGALPPANLLGDYLNSIGKLPPDAVHLFWTNNQAVCEQVREAAVAAGRPNVCVMDIGIFRDDGLFTTITRLLDAHKYVLAADILKILILHRFGGIYSDLGVLYDEGLYHLVRTGDYGFVLGEQGFFQLSFVASTPESELTCIFLATLNYPSAFDRSYLLSPSEVRPLDEVHIFAGLGFTVCAALFLPPTARTLILPPQCPGHFQWLAQRSWYGSEPKHGNAIVERTDASILRLQDFLISEQEFQASVHIVGDVGLLKEQLQVLLRLAPYFTKHPTRFCRSFFFNGSDKALGWHNYGYVYNFILGPRTNTIRLILEVGIGTNNPDVPSSMGSNGVPGASLRAWRELFSRAAIVGADIDERILFQEERIATYSVDQRDTGAIRALFAAMGDQMPDLIIDDGLHAFDANKTFFEAAFPMLATNGLYIIEDVVHADAPAWEAYLAAAGYRAAIMRIPHPRNAIDNCLVLVLGQSVSPRSVN
jgi:hypothetical protein